MSYHIRQLLKITARFCKVFPTFLCVFFVSYINQNHKATTHPWGRRLDTTLYIDQNVSQVCEPEFLKIWRMKIYLLKKIGRFQLKKRHFKIAKKLVSRLFLYSLSQYPHQQKFFGVLLIYCVLDASIFILLYSTRNIFAENRKKEKNIKSVLKKV